MFTRFKKLLTYSNHLQKPLFIAWAAFFVSYRFLNSKKSGKHNISGLWLNYFDRASGYGMFHEIFVDQNYYLKQTVEPVVIIDCGSNVGFSLAYFKLVAPNSKIFAFEPNPFTFELLKKNVEENNLSDVQLNCFALSNTNGSATFYTDKNSTGSQGASLTKHLVTKNRELEEIKVEVKKLSEHLPEKYDILKLDVEGAEGEIVSDLATSGKLSNFKKIFIEYHYDGENTIYPLSAILGHLESAGFEYEIVSPCSLPFVNKKQIYSYKITAFK